MKNIALLLLVLTLGFSSCEKEKEIEKDTIINITVKNAAGPLDNFSVHMFTDQTWNTIGNDRSFARKTVVTDEFGVANFILNERTDLETLMSD